MAHVSIFEDIYIPDKVESCAHHSDEQDYISKPLLIGLRYINRPYVIRGAILQSVRHVAKNLTSIYDDNNENVVQAQVKVDNLNTRNAQSGVRLDAEQLQDFQIMMLDFIKTLTIGIYKLKLAPPHVQDKVQRDHD
ncbi:hypothetical protein JTB14_004740 [Gonioctena quinquepunctata]|nr:hypothetical protein JTB14_004740 [Gonioctena quinquepunctata]